MDAAELPAPLAPPSAAWDETRTAHLVLRAAPASYASQVRDALAERAERAWQRGSEWLGADAADLPITVYLVDWLDEAPHPGWARVESALVAPDRALVCVPVSPESPALGLERAILGILASRTQAQPPAATAELIPALAALLAAEHGVGPDVDALPAAARAKPGRPQASPFAAPADAVAFLAYLQRLHGGAALTRFVRGAREGSLAAAAQTAYGRSLEALQAEWQAALRRQPRDAATGQGVLAASLPLLRPYRFRVAELLLLMIGDLGFTLSVPLSAKFLFDNVIVPQNYGLLPLWLGVVLAVFMLGSLATYRRATLGGWIAESVMRDVRRAMFAHLQRLSLRFYTQASAGDLLSRLTNDVRAVEDSLAGSLPQLTFAVISLVVGTITLLLLNWMLGLLVLVVGVPLFAAVYIRGSGRLREASLQLQQGFAAIMTAVEQNIAAQLVIKTFSLEQRAITAFDEVLGRLFHGSLRVIGISARLTAGTEMTALGVRVGALALGAVLIMNGQMTVGELVAFAGLIGEVLNPVTSIARQYAQLQSASGAFGRIREILDDTPEVVEDPLARELPPLARDVRLDGVSFGYGPGATVLRDVTLTIPAGARVAIVGPSGAGKSTLVGLLLRLYDPTAGRILFDGHDVRAVTHRSLRDQIAVVPQDTFLFDTTVRENVALGREGATDADVVRAARAAALHPFVERLEQGYEARVGERGARLSGGQRQRLAIARALVRDPRLLILDEATSALDPQTEAAILQTIEQVGRDRTTVMITHRLSAAVRCDRIFVLEAGRLVEAGSHAALLERRGLYWRLWTEQQGGLEDAGALAVDPSRLAQVPLFSGLTPGELALLARRVTVERAEAGAELVRQGEVADKLFVITAGEVDVIVQAADGAEQRVAVLSAPGYFGEIALLGDDSARRTATVRTRGPTDLYGLHKEDFLGLLASHQQLARDVQALAQARAAQTRAILAGQEARPA
jgi:ABC-type multidrug transport system fused ATPase/permease subunit